MFAGGGMIPEDGAKEYLRRACKYARTHETYLIPERFLLMEYQCMCLISPAGKVLGAQKALYLNTATRVGKHSAGIEIVRTEFGGVFLCVDVDIYRPEVARIAASMGAQFIFCSQSIDPKDYNSSMVLTGAWNAAQLTGVYVAVVSGEFSCVASPLSLSKHEDGFTAPPTIRLPVTAKLDAERLRTVKLPHRLSRRFYSLHRSDLLR
jgi:enoyl-CoA hydratase/carnithine racemase